MGIVFLEGGVDGVLAEDFADNVCDIVPTVEKLPDLGEVPMLEGHGSGQESKAAR